MSVSLIDGHIDDEDIDTSKQIPKKVESEPWWNRVAYFCPDCKMEIRVEGRTICGSCGQALDWSETE